MAGHASLFVAVPIGGAAIVVGVILNGAHPLELLVEGVLHHQPLRPQNGLLRHLWRLLRAGKAVNLNRSALHGLLRAHLLIVDLLPVDPQQVALLALLGVAADVVVWVLPEVVGLQQHLGNDASQDAHRQVSLRRLCAVAGVRGVAQNDAALRAEAEAVEVISVELAGLVARVWGPRLHSRID